MRLVSALILIATVGLTASSAQAACAPRDAVVKSLARDFAEYPTFVAIQNDGNSLLEFFVSEEGTWTVIESYADGRACSRASGTGWMQVPSEEPSA